MIKFKRIFILFVVFPAVCLQACYTSNSPDHGDVPPDSPDAIDVTGDDARSDDDAGPPDLPPPDAPADAVNDTDSVPGPYVLHEWGVISISELGILAHGPTPTSPEMIAEKPVIYLYADEEIESLDVRIDFSSGGASDVWPEIPTGRSIAWNDLAVRSGACETTPFPYPWDEPLCEVCNLSSCVVDGASCITYAHEDDIVSVSTLLFYAGPLSDYIAPLDVFTFYELDADDVDEIVFRVSNPSAFDIEGAWLIYRQTEDVCEPTSSPVFYCPVTAAEIAFKFIESIPAGTEFYESLPIYRYEAPLGPDGFPTGDLPLPEDWHDMGKDLTAELIDRGLAEKEAGAFLLNWDQVYFGLLGSDSYNLEPLYSDGPFIIYFMDRHDYDDQFELTADPPPMETVRVGMIYEKLPIMDI